MTTVDLVGVESFVEARVHNDGRLAISRPVCEAYRKAAKWRHMLKALRVERRGAALILTRCAKNGPGAVYELSDRVRALIPGIGRRGDVFDVTVSAKGIVVHLDRLIDQRTPKPQKRQKIPVAKLRQYGGKDTRAMSKTSNRCVHKDPAGTTNQHYFQSLWHLFFPLPRGYSIKYNRESPSEQAKRLKNRGKKGEYLTPIHQVRTLRYSLSYLTKRLRKDGSTISTPGERGAVFRTLREVFDFMYQHAGVKPDPNHLPPPKDADLPPYDPDYMKKPPATVKRSAAATPKASQPLNGTSLSKLTLEELESDPKRIQVEIEALDKAVSAATTRRDKLKNLLAALT